MSYQPIERNVWALTMIDATSTELIPRVTLNTTSYSTARVDCQLMASNFCAAKQQYGAQQTVTFYDQEHELHAAAAKSAASWFAGLWTEKSDDCTCLTIYLVKKKPDGYVFNGSVKLVVIAQIYLQSLSACFHDEIIAPRPIKTYKIS